VVRRARSLQLERVVEYGEAGKLAARGDWMKGVRRLPKRKRSSRTALRCERWEASVEAGTEERGRLEPVSSA
jgi:hypothetical protein